MDLDPVWAPVIAALGASFLTGFFTFGVASRERWQRRREQRDQARVKAYSNLLSAAANVIFTADGLRIAANLRSGPREGLDVLLRLRKPVDPFDVMDRMSREYSTLQCALTAVWLHGSPAAIRLANQVVACAAELFPATADRPNCRFLGGPLPAANPESCGSSRARKDLGELARRELKQEHVDLFEE